jgi:hypothetical protein
VAGGKQNNAGAPEGKQVGSSRLREPWRRGLEAGPFLPLLVLLLQIRDFWSAEQCWRSHLARGC